MLTGSPIFVDELPLSRNAAVTPVHAAALTLPTDSDLHSTSASPESSRMFEVSILRPPRALARPANRRNRNPAAAPPCRGRARCKPFSVQPIGGMCARVDGEHTGVVVVAGDLTGGELRHVLAGAVAVKARQGRFDRRSRLSVRVGHRGMSEKSIQLVFDFSENINIC